MTELKTSLKCRVDDCKNKAVNILHMKNTDLDGNNLRYEKVLACNACTYKLYALSEELE